jgi:hypothetical protein
MLVAHDLAATRRWLRRYWARHGTAQEKLLARIEPTPGCWLWPGGKNSWGYGVITAEGRVQSAHRVSWEVHHGPIPAGMQVCHRCDVRDCVRPDHLFLGTAKDNVADMDAKGRRGRGWKAVRRGEMHQAAKLSDAEAAAVREAVGLGESRRSVARRFGISHTYVGMLVRGERRN